MDSTVNSPKAQFEVQYFLICTRFLVDDTWLYVAASLKTRSDTRIEALNQPLNLILFGISKIEQKFDSLSLETLPVCPFLSVKHGC